jgi:hypothetical protein
MFSDRFDELMSKIIFFKMKKHYFDAFLDEKHLKKKTTITLPNTLLE